MATAVMGASDEDGDDLEKHVAYIHFNPVKHGYVRRAPDWPHSSIHREIAKGTLNADWGNSSQEENGRWG